jgi:hypothetical protein
MAVACANFSPPAIPKAGKSGGISGNFGFDQLLSTALNKCCVAFVENFGLIPSTQTSTPPSP